MNSCAYTFTDLREKMVINVADGKQLGRLCDMAFSSSGNIIGIILPGEKKIFKSFGCMDNIFVPWATILKIGDDVILVDLVNSSNCNPQANKQHCGYEIE